MTTLLYIVTTLLYKQYKENNNQHAEIVVALFHILVDNQHVQLEVCHTNHATNQIILDVVVSTNYTQNKTTENTKNHDKNLI